MKITADPEFIDEMTKRLDAEEAEWRKIEARHARIDMRDELRIRRLELEAERHGLLVERGKGRGWSPLLSYGQRDRCDLGGLSVTDMRRHFLDPSLIAPPTKTYGPVFDLSVEDAEAIVTEFAAHNDPLDAETVTRGVSKFK